MSHIFALSPTSTTVPEPMSVLSLLAVGAFGAGVLSKQKL
ncbi:MAG: PEP-CTERM sorting domain-containing protein [Moorea sp. SIO2I5]|nr:PEP-CTERM sorting domain-containing protein [Moorena sp. SIO2I5]